LEKKTQSATEGLVPLTLSLFSSSNKKLGSLVVNSGQGWNQTFLQAGKGMPTNYAPIEEGIYDLGKLEWAGKKGNYSATFGPGLGPVWVSIEPAAGNITRRSAFGIHLDANRDVSPGSMGCVVARSQEDLETIVSWFSGKYPAPERLYVNWGLGTVKMPGTSEEVSKVHRFKLFAHSGKVSAVKDGEPARWSLVKLFMNNRQLACNLNYEEVDLEAAEIKLSYKLKSE